MEEKPDEKKLLSREMIRFYRDIIEDCKREIEFFETIYLRNFSDSGVRDTAQDIIENIKENIEVFKKRLVYYGKNC